MSTSDDFELMRWSVINCLNTLANEESCVFGGGVVVVVVVVVVCCCC